MALFNMSPTGLIGSVFNHIGLYIQQHNLPFEYYYYIILFILLNIIIHIPLIIYSYLFPSICTNIT